MRFTRITLKNFLAYAELDYQFVQSPKQIQGENKSDDGQLTNGACKSGILNAVEFAVTGMNSRGVNDAELVMYGENSSEIRLFTHCGVRKKILEIHWTIKTKDSNVLELRQCNEGSEDWTPIDFSNVNDGKKAILDWMVMSKDDFFNYYVISKDRFKSFFKASSKSNIELINRFSDASIIDGLDLSLDGEIAKIESAIRSLKDKGLQLDGQKAASMKLLEDQLNRDIEAEKKAASEELSSEIIRKKAALDSAKHRKNTAATSYKALCTESVKLEELLKKSETEVDEFTHEVDEAMIKQLNSDIKLTKSEDKKVSDKLNEYDIMSRKARTRVSELETMLAGLITCPACGHTWDDSENLSSEEITKFESDLAGLKDLRVQISETADNASKKRDTILVKIESLRKKLSKYTEQEELESQELRRLKRVVEDNVAAIRSHEVNKANYENNVLPNIEEDIKIIANQIKNLEESVNSVTISLDQGLIKSLKADIKSLSKKGIDLESEITEETAALTDKVRWKEGFKKFKLYVANQSLGVIQNQCNLFLKDMASDMRVKLTGSRMLANGKTKEEIAPLIIRNGRERTFGSFSGGEKGRLMFAGILANKRMIDLSHPYGGLDFLGIDEIFEGVDSLGMSNLMRAVEDFDMTILVITHVSDEFMDNNTIKVVKENDIAKLII